ITLLPAIPFGFADDAGDHVQIADGPQHLFGAKRLDDDSELFHTVRLSLSWERPTLDVPIRPIVSSDWRVCPAFFCEEEITLFVSRIFYCRDAPPRLSLLHNSQPHLGESLVSFLHKEHLMRGRCLLSAAFVLTLLVSAGADDKNDKDKLDPEKLVGTYTYVSGERNGEKVPEDNLKKGTVVITKDTITLKGDETFV